MKHLVAYLGVRGGGLQKILSTNSSIFDIQDTSYSQEYDPAYKLEDEEWFFITNFKEKNFNNDFIDKASPLTTTSLNQIAENNYKKIKYLAYEDNGYKYFQKILTSNLISRKWFTVSQAPILESNKKIISLNKDPDAIYNINSDTLYFKDISRIKIIFKNIDSLFREATQTEVDGFLQQEFIELKDGFSGSDVKVPNRKRLALIVDKLSSFTDLDKNTVLNYIHEYCTDVPFENGKFSITTEDDLKLVLFGIDERFYTTNLGHEKRLANSVITID